MYINKHEFRVRYSEVDRMNIVYHANYINWFEIGRTEFLRALGYTYSELEAEKIWLPIIEIGCKYKSPVTYDEIVRVETYVEDCSRVKIKFVCKVYCGERLLVQGFTILGVTNDKLRPLGLNKVKPELYEKLLNCIK